jgi:hypothetical protein
MRPLMLLPLIVATLAADPALAGRASRPAALTPDAVNQAQWSSDRRTVPDPVVLKAQVPLDRASFLPGAIDARGGENFCGARVPQANALAPTGRLDRPTFDKLAATSDDEVVRRYTITAADLKGPFVASIPRDFRGVEKLDRLGYRSPRELLAERFHLSGDLLSARPASSCMARPR